MSTPLFDDIEGVTPVVEIGIGDTRVSVGAAQFDVSRFDSLTSTFSGSDPLWTDMTCFVQEMEFTTGRERATDRFQPGDATLVMDNTTGWADMNANDIPTEDRTVTVTSLTMRAGRPIRIGVDHETFGRVWMWRGFVDEMTPIYDPEDGDSVILRCYDALGEAGRPELARLTAPVGAGERGSTRINRILDAAKWPAEHRQIASTSTTMIATELGQQTIDMLTACADSEGGAVFGDLEGRVAYRGKDWQTYPPEQPNDGTIGNVMTGVDPFIEMASGAYTLDNPSLLTEVAPGAYVEA